MTRVFLVVLALALTFNLAASQMLNVEACPAVACNNSCLNCSNSTNVTANNSANPVVLCPANGSFCWVQFYWPNDTWSLENCSACANSSNNSCTGCQWVATSFVGNFCSSGSCWMIDYNNSMASNGSNGTNGSNVTSTVIASIDCNCSMAMNNSNGSNDSSGANDMSSMNNMTGLWGVDPNGNPCVCPLVANTTHDANGSSTTVINSHGLNASFTVASGTYLKFCLGVLGLTIASLLL